MVLHVIVARETGGVLNETDTYREWAPPPGWEHAVACLWEQRVARARIQRVVPDAHADVLIYDSGRVEIVGLADAVALPALAAGTTLCGVRLRPEAVGAAIRTPASNLRNLTVPAEELLGSRQARRLADPRGLDAWVRGVRSDGQVADAVRLLGAHSVEQVAGLLGVSCRHLRRMLLAQVGLAPKAFQQVVRLQRFVCAADRGAPLAAAAADAGYADQAHLTREVRRFAGLTPAMLVRERSGRRQVQ
jgi:AraC-like DNA-binding protein